MISVLTMTYKRKNFLEECIYSFLQQKTSFKKEMIIINDDEHVEYIFNHPEIKIVNVKERFTSIGSKLHFGIQHCSYEFIYRLDDDDLLAPNGLHNIGIEIIENPGYNVYRSMHHYGFRDNKFEGRWGGINTGNVFDKNFISEIPIIDKSFGEDTELFILGRTNQYESNSITMIYRWGMNTYHASVAFNPEHFKNSEEIDKHISEKSSALIGTYSLVPHFDTDYYEQLREANYDNL